MEESIICIGWPAMICGQLDFFVVYRITFCLSPFPQKGKKKKINGTGKRQSFFFEFLQEFCTFWKTKLRKVQKNKKKCRRQRQHSDKSYPVNSLNFFLFFSVFQKKCWLNSFSMVRLEIENKGIERFMRKKKAWSLFLMQSSNSNRYICNNGAAATFFSLCQKKLKSSFRGHGTIRRTRVGFS